MLDVHVHLRDGSQSAKETILHGIRSGSAAMITSFFDMPNTAVPLTSAAAITERLAHGNRVASEVSRQVGKDIFYGVYGGVSADPRQLAEMVDLYRREQHLVALKMFAGHSTGNMGLTGQDMQQRVYDALAAHGYDGVLAVHCEKESLLHPELYSRADPASHGRARPAEAEIASVADQIAFARQSGFRGTLHICHISTAKAIALVREARKDGMRVTCGATAHHALLSESVAGRPGNLLKMNPPLRGESDRLAVFAGLCDGSVDWIESDHAPHTLQDKEEGASGIPGFAGTLLLIRTLRAAGVSEEQLRRLCGERACAIYGLDLPVTVPSESQIEEALPTLRAAYPWDPFDSIA